MEITKQGAQSLRIKMRNVELYLKEAVVIYGFHPLAARLPELASKLERLNCPTWSTPSTGASFQLITRRVSDDTKLLKFTSLRWPEIATKRASISALHLSVV